MAKKIALAKDYAKVAEGNIRRAGKPASKENKVARMKALLDKGGSAKVAEAMVGPISIRLNYEGIARQALVEDMPDAKAGVPAYDVLNDLPVAYHLNSNDGQVRISRVEGKRVIPKYGRIAAEWEIQRTDIEFMKANIVEYANNMTTQQIMKAEDEMLYNGFDLLIDDWQKANGKKTDNVIQLTSNKLTLDDLVDAEAQIASQQLEAKCIIANPADVMDIKRWDALTTGMAFKEDYFAGYPVLTFGTWNILRSVTVPRGTVYVTAAPDFVGVFSTIYGLESTDDVTGANKFLIRTIMDELVSEVLINRNAVVKLKKA